MLLFSLKFKIKKETEPPSIFQLTAPPPPRREEEKRESLYAAAHISNRLFFLFTHICLKYNSFFRISKKLKKFFSKFDVERQPMPASRECEYHPSNK